MIQNVFFPKQPWRTPKTKLTFIRSLGFVENNDGLIVHTLPTKPMSSWCQCMASKCRESQRLSLGDWMLDTWSLGKILWIQYASHLPTLLSGRLWLPSSFSSHLSKMAPFLWSCGTISATCDCRRPLKCSHTTWLTKGLMLNC